jgi:hypothetical protein
MQQPCPSKLGVPRIQEKKKVFSNKLSDVSDNEILQIHTNIIACDYKGPWSCMEVGNKKKKLGIKKIELVTLTTTSIAIKLGRPKTHKSGEQFSTMARMT